MSCSTINFMKTLNSLNNNGNKSLMKEFRINLLVEQFV